MNQMNEIPQEEITHLSNVFAGREKELQYLNNLFTKMLHGSGSFIVITGEAGTGKSALVREFVNGVRHQGIRFISESFQDVPAYEPYSPFLKIIAKLGGSSLRQLMNKMENGGKTENETGKSGETQASWNMESLFSLQSEKGLAQQHLVSGMLDASKEKPLILALTDVHLASLSAWQFIHYLTHSVVDHQIMIFVTIRQDGKVLNQEKVPLYADVLQRMNRERLIEKMNLYRFGKSEIRKYIRKAFHRTDFSNQLIPLLLAATGGLPSQFVELLKKMLEKKIIFKQDGVWFNNENISKEQFLNLVGEDIKEEEVSQLLNNLDILQRTLLEYGALSGGKLDHRILSLVLGMSPIKVLKELRKFADQKILIAMPDGEYQFKKPVIQTFLLERINTESKINLHKEIARAIEKADHLEKNKKIFLLAYHYQRTNNWASAVKYLHQAGDLALPNLAFSEAREYYREAINLSAKMSESSPEIDLVELELKAAWVERMLGDREESLKYCKTARNLLKEKGDDSFKVQILLQEGFSYMKLNNWERAKEKFNRCLGDESEASDFNRSLANFGLGTIYFELSEYQVAQNYFEAALRVAKKLDSHKLIANILNNLGALENVQGNGIKAITLYSQSIPLFEKIGDRGGLAHIYHNIGMTHAEDGHWKAANEFYGKSLGISDTLGLLPLKSITFLNRALALAYLQEFEDAEEYNFKARRLLLQLNDGLGIAEYHKIQGVILREKQEWNEAEKEFSTAIHKYEDIQNRLGVAETQCEWARLAKAKGETVQEETWVKKCLASFEELGLKRKVVSIKKEFQLEKEQQVAAVPSV